MTNDIIFEDLTERPPAVSASVIISLVRTILGLAWDEDHHPHLPDRFGNRPISITAMYDGYDYAWSFAVCLMGSPPRTIFMISAQGHYAKHLCYEQVPTEDEMALIRAFIEAVFGKRIDQIPMGSHWISHDRKGNPLPFPSGKTWTDIRVPAGLRP